MSRAIVAAAIFLASLLTMAGGCDMFDDIDQRRPGAVVK